MGETTVKTFQMEERKMKKLLIGLLGVLLLSNAAYYTFFSIFQDEIIGFDPIIINSDINKIV